MSQTFLELEVFVVERIVTLEGCPSPVGLSSSLSLSVPFPREQTEVELLLGSNHLWKVLQDGESNTFKKLTDSWGIVRTKFGDVPMGVPPARVRSTVQEDFQIQSFLTGPEQLALAVEHMWKLEELPHDSSDTSLTRDEVLAVEKIKQIMSFDWCVGRFTTGLLWRGEPELINNFNAARSRLETLLRKLRKDPKQKDAYVRAMNEFIEMGVVRLVDDPRGDDPLRTDLYYLPHRGVYDESKLSTPLRPVFDASHKTATGKSLNSCLLSGPPLQLNIVSIELRFRTRRIALVGDISKMFLRIAVLLKDQSFLRFLWKDPDDVTGKPKIYSFTSLIFGAVDAPFQAITALQTLVNEVLGYLDKEGLDEPDLRVACEVIRLETYVDDITTSGNTVDEVILKYKGLTRLLDHGGFKVKKWATNSPAVLREIPEESRSPFASRKVAKGFVKEISLPISTLGLRWHPDEDVLTFDQYDHLAECNEDTKTSVASLLAKLFDVLGLISPFILRARVIMKETFKEKLGWRDSLTGPLLASWHQWVQQLGSLKNLRFQRHIPLNEDSEIHIFGDASTEAGFGAAVYVRNPLDARRKKFHADLLMAKSRVAPMKEMTIPRLELKAAVLCAELGQQLVNDLGIDKAKITCHGDNQVSLYWLKKEPRMLIPFVANRVEKVQGYGFPFRYVRTDENPADIASRGCDVRDLNCDLWLHGPAFLSKPKSEWENVVLDGSKIDASEGMRKQHVFTFLSKPEPLIRLRGEDGDVDALDLLEYHSSHERLLRATAKRYAMLDSWKANMRTPKDGRKDNPRPKSMFDLLPVHFRKAQIFWVHFVQMDVYEEEIAHLDQGEPVPKHSKIRPLCPVLDADNELGLPLLRLGSRLALSQMSYKSKHPLILPRHHRYTQILGESVHLQRAHPGIEWLHVHLRQTYWIPQGRQFCRSITRHCTQCRKLNADRAGQLMAPLPADRINIAPAFSVVGIDYTAAVQMKPEDYGPELDKKGRPFRIPGYIVVFVCMITRAIHLEVVRSNSTEEFVMAFKRFVNTRGWPVKVYSDNAKTFKSAERNLNDVVKNANQALAANDRYDFEWIYSTEYAPNTGGAWEAAVKLIKHPLIKTVGTASLTYVELLTFCKVVEGQVNDRPLFAAADDSLEAVTPSQLVNNRKIRPFVDKFIDAKVPKLADTPLEERWKLHNALAQSFWKTWQSAYRVTLHNRAKWDTKQPSVRVGDLVLVEEELKKRNDWKLARVVELMTDRRGDGHVRTVKLTVGPIERKHWAGHHVTKDALEDAKPIDSKGKKGVIRKTPPKLFTRSVRQVFPLEITADRGGDAKSKPHKRV